MKISFQLPDGTWEEVGKVTSLKPEVIERVPVFAGLHEWNLRWFDDDCTKQVEHTLELAPHEYKSETKRDGSAKD
jgi:hypothetical protein